jgi:hypothetical protein
MPDKYGFDHLIRPGATILACIEDGCDAKGPQYLWPEQARKDHFLTHSPEIVPFSDITSTSLRMRKDSCRICGESFDQERKRGRPRVLCFVCKPE